MSINNDIEEAINYLKSTSLGKSKKAVNVLIDYIKDLENENQIAKIAISALRDKLDNPNV